MRYDNIDMVKAFGLYLMILGHNATVSSITTDFIYSFHMPLFFIISGMFHKKDVDFVQTFKKAVKSLLIPYFVVNILVFSFFCLTAFPKGALSIEFVINRIVPILIGLGYNTQGFVPVSTPLWFFYVLFFIKIIASVHACLLKNVKITFF